MGFLVVGFGFGFSVVGSGSGSGVVSSTVGATDTGACAATVSFSPAPACPHPATTSNAVTAATILMRRLIDAHLPHEDIDDRR
ncbi:hypothetical protein Ait01nite_080970 [Actinoplanes italicus]|nr:hypothetical protein Ait01nite_080970 [Actinoplanes italicus]